MSSPFVCTFRAAEAKHASLHARGSVARAAALESQAFSLVEVVLSLGIVSFAVLTLVALLPIGLKSEKTSASETAAVNIMHSLVSDLTASPLANSTSSRFQITPLPGNVSTATTTNFYMTEGQQITNAAAAQYRVVMSFYPPNNTVGAYAPPAVLIQISWPAVAAVANAQGLYESYATFPAHTL